MTNAIQFVQGQIVLLAALDEPAALRRFLDAVEAGALAPTHWGSASGIRDPYGRGDLEAFVASRQRVDLVPHLLRNRAPRYDAHWHTNERGITSFEITAVGPSADDAASVFDGVEALADALGAELATVDVRFAGQDPATHSYGSGSVHHLESFLREGPHTIFPRTILGARILGLMGGTAAVEQSGAATRHLPHSGGIALDVLPTPWVADPSVLKRAQVDVDRHLRLAGILTRKAADADLPAPRWRPPR